MHRSEAYDFLVIGGGLFGIYAALYLHRRGGRVRLVESGGDWLAKASTVNQARLHAGYHYPRSIATARTSDEHKARFTTEHAHCVFATFDQYYAIDRYSSLTNADQFARFCAYLDLPCEPVVDHPYFDDQQLEAVFKTREASFDPLLLAADYRARLAATPAIEASLHTYPLAAEPAGDRWRVRLQVGDTEAEVTAGTVLNATYTALNGVNRLFGQPDLALQHEISEIALLTSPELRDTGLTVMDGPFVSIMPFGKTGLLSLSSVAYTHRSVSYAALPTFDCMNRRADCQPDRPANCRQCPQAPATAFAKMAAQLRRYLRPQVRLRYFGSLYTIKSKLRANHIDDGRPTAIQRLGAGPDFYCIFAGKINSIYEIEKFF